MLAGDAVVLHPRAGHGRGVLVPGSLLQRLGHHGVTRIEYIAGFDFPWKYGVWLCTSKCRS